MRKIFFFPLYLMVAVNGRDETMYKQIYRPHFAKPPYRFINDRTELDKARRGLSIKIHYGLTLA
jgi:hypothetical protein